MKCVMQANRSGNIAALFLGSILFAAIGENHECIPIEEAIEPKTKAGAKFVNLSFRIEEFEGFTWI